MGTKARADAIKITIIFSMFEGFVISLNSEIAPTLSIERWYRDLYADTTNPIHFYDDELPASLESFEAVCIAYFVDIEYYCIRITGILQPKPPRILYVTGMLSGECTMDHLMQRVKWLETATDRKTGPLFANDPLLEYTTRKMLGSTHPMEKVAFFNTPFDHGPTLKANGLTMDAIKAEDVPDLQLPIQPGRFVQLAESDLVHYLWEVYERGLRETKTMSAHFQLWEPLRLLREPKQSKRRRTTAATCEPVDIEDLHSLLPPCMKHTGDFPKDTHRQYLVRTLQTAGVSLHSVEDLLTKLNQKFPHKDGSMDVRKRWDFEQHYEKAYKPPTCETVGSMCPFVGNKKLQCHQLFMAEFPNTQTDVLHGPANWMQWVVKSLINPSVIRASVPHKK